MKKSLKAGLCASLLALPLFAGVSNTFATGLGSENQAVTVGNVENTVYSVDIIWGDMTHDWVYHDGMGAFTFKPRTSCTKYYIHPVAGNVNNRIIGLANNQGRLYSDSECTEPIENVFASTPSGDNLYPPDSAVYIKDVSGSIMVYDDSQNGKVKAQVSYTAASGYSWAQGSFVDHCTRLELGYCLKPDIDTMEGNTLENDYLSSMGLNSRNLLYGHLVLSGIGVLGEYEVTSGDTVGNVTVTVSPYGG